jgi:O-antigen/teichoic acid export membrane protein
MLQSIKRLTKHSAVYGIGHILSRSMGFILLPIQTKFIPEDRYGVAAMLISSLAILNVVFSYGMDVAFLRFFIMGKDRREKEKIFSTAHWMIFSTGILFASLLFAFPDVFSKWILGEPGQGLLVRYAAGICFFDAVRLLPFLTLRSEEKSFSYIALNSLNIAVTLLLNILFVAVWKMDIEGIFLANLIASAFTVLTTIPVFKQWLRFSFSREVLRELMGFGLPYVPSGLAYIVMDQISRFFIAWMISKAAAGVFSACYKLGMFMALIVAAFRFAWHPFFLTTLNQKDAPRVFGRVLTYFLAVTGFFFLMVSVFLQEIVRLRIGSFQLLDSRYMGGIGIVPIVLLCYILYGVYANFVVGIYLKKKSALLSIFTGSGMLVTLAANWLLVPRFGITGSAWATFLGYVTMAAGLYIANQRLYPIPYEFGRILKLILVIAVVFTVGVVPGREWSVLIRLGLIVLAFPMLVALRFFQPGEKKAVLRLLQRFQKAGSG